jgi:hypothetical protein
VADFTYHALFTPPEAVDSTAYVLGVAQSERPAVLALHLERFLRAWRRPVTARAYRSSSGHGRQEWGQPDCRHPVQHGVECQLSNTRAPKISLYIIRSVSFAQCIVYARARLFPDV